MSAKSVAVLYDLTDTSGAPVPDGLYKVTLLMQDGRYYGHASYAKVVVIR